MHFKFGDLCKETNNKSCFVLDGSSEAISSFKYYVN